MFQPKRFLPILVFFLTISLQAQILFERRYGINTDNFEYTGGAALAPDGGMVLYGNTEQGHTLQFFLQKLDTSGVEVWRQEYGQLASGAAAGVVSADGGGYWATGAVLNPADGSYDALLLRTDENGNYLWHKTYGNQATDIGLAICRLAGGQIAVLGSTTMPDNSAAHFQAVFDPAGNLVHSASFAADNEVVDIKATATSDGGYAAVVFAGFDFFSQTSVRAIKYNAAYAQQWSGSVGSMSIYTGSNITDLFDLKATSTGVLFCLQTEAGAHLVHRANGNAAVLWSKRLRSTYTEGAAVQPYANGTIGVVSHSFPYVYKELSADGATLDSVGVLFFPLAPSFDIRYLMPGAQRVYLYGNAPGDQDTYSAARISVAGTPALLWQQSFGNFAPNEDETGDAVAGTTDGGFVLVGTRLDTLGDAAVWVLKADPQGAVLWEKLYSIGTGVFNNARLGSVKVDAAGNAIVLAASSFSDPEYHLLKISPAGVLLFDKIIATSGYYAESFRAYPLADGGFIACITLEEDEFIPSLVRVAPNGNVLWAKEYDGTQLNDVTPLAGGNFACAGVKNGKPWVFGVDAAGNLQWEQTYSVSAVGILYSITQTSDGYLAAVGAAGNASETQIDALALKASATDGALFWHKTFNKGANSFWFATTALPTPGGGVCMTGVFLEPPANVDLISAFFRQRVSVSWLDAAGNPLAHQGFGNDATRPVSGNADLAADGNIIFCATIDPGTALQDAWVVKVKRVTVAAGEPDLAGALALAPNPASDETHIQLASPYRGPVWVQVFDLQGRQMTAFNSEKNAENWSAAVLLRHWPVGLYQAVVRTPEGQEVLKFAVQR